MNLFHQWIQYKYLKLLIYFWENFQVRKMQKNVEICKRDKITWESKMQAYCRHLQREMQSFADFSQSFAGLCGVLRKNADNFFPQV